MNEWRTEGRNERKTELKQADSAEMHLNDVHSNADCNML